MALQNAIAVSTVAWLVCKPVMISTPFWIGTGFMKCVDTTREEAEVSVGSFVVDAAIRVIEIEEVLVARMVCAWQIWAREENIWNFRDGISGTASITKSTDERSSMDVVGVRSERILSDWSWVMRCLVTSLARSLSAGG
jgi:hypothetical protein